GISFVLIPHSPSLFIFYTFAFICGIHSGLGGSITSVWLIEIWQEKCHPILHVQHFLCAVGYFIGPAIFGGFVVGNEDKRETKEEIVSNITFIDLISIEANHFDSIHERKLSLTWPFLIIGLLFLIIGV